MIILSGLLGTVKTFFNECYQILFLRGIIMNKKLLISVAMLMMLLSQMAYSGGGGLGPGPAGPHPKISLPGPAGETIIIIIH